jgi:cytochrome c553
LATEGDASRKNSRGMTCHDGTAGNPVFPRLAGLEAGYIATQLKLFRDGSRGGTSYHHVMAAVAGKLEDADIEALAACLSQAGRH